MSDPSPARDTPRQSATKTIVLWLVLIGLFMGFYTHFSGHTLMAWRIGKTVVSVLFVLLIIKSLLAQARLRQREDRWDLARKAAVLEDSGQLDEAARQWEGLVNMSNRDSPHRVDFILRQAWVALRQGQAKQAMQLLEPVLSREDARERELAHALLALVMVVRGHLPRTESLLNGIQDGGVRGGVMGGLATQVLLLRRGEHEQALALAVPPWDIADAHCHHLRRLWALLRAFALEQLPPTPEWERDALRTRAELRDARPGEFDYLTEQWPEMRAFLAQRLTAGETGASPGAASEASGAEGPQAFTSASFGLGIPARWDPLRQTGNARWTLFLLALLGGFTSLLFLKGTFIGLEIALLVVLVLATLAGIWMPGLLAHRGVARNQQGIDAIHARRLDEAARIFDELLDKTRGSFLFHQRQVLLFNRANTFFHTGERSLARRIFHALAHQSPRTTPPQIRALTWASLAECEALDGNFGRARELEGVVSALLQENHSRLWNVTPLLLALHEGDTEAVSEQAGEMLANPEMPEHYRRRVALLHAFALEREEHPTPEQREDRARLQEQLRQQALPGEFDHLATEWPELRTFLEGLGKTRAAA
jgi:hypothetical protein